MSDRLTDQQLTELREIHSEGGGPWRVSDGSDVLCDIESPECSIALSLYRTDGVLVVAMHAALPGLLDEIERIRDKGAGGEAEELRKGIETLISEAIYSEDFTGEQCVTTSDLQGLLDEVDARDSLAFLERAQDKAVKDETDACAAIAAAKYRELATKVETYNEPTIVAIHEQCAVTAAEIEESIRARGKTDGG